MLGGVHHPQVGAGVQFGALERPDAGTITSDGTEVTALRAKDGDGSPLEQRRMAGSA